MAAHVIKGFAVINREGGLIATSGDASVVITCVETLTNTSWEELQKNGAYLTYVTIITNGPTLLH